MATEQQMVAKYATLLVSTVLAATLRMLLYTFLVTKHIAELSF